LAYCIDDSRIVCAPKNYSRSLPRFEHSSCYSHLLAFCFFMVFSILLVPSCYERHSQVKRKHGERESFPNRRTCMESTSRRESLRRCKETFGNRDGLFYRASPRQNSDSRIRLLNGHVNISASDFPNRLSCRCSCVTLSMRQEPPGRSRGQTAPQLLGYQPATSYPMCSGRRPGSCPSWQVQSLPLRFDVVLPSIVDHRSVPG
jgi:hypothetical protein